MAAEGKTLCSAKCKFLLWE